MCSLFEDRGEYVDSKLHLISKKFIQEVKGAERVTRKKKKKKKGKLEGKDTELYFARSALIWAMPPLFFYSIYRTFARSVYSSSLLMIVSPATITSQLDRIKTLLTGPPLANSSFSL